MYRNDQGPILYALSKFLIVFFFSKKLTFRQIHGNENSITNFIQKENKYFCKECIKCVHAKVLLQTSFNQVSRDKIKIVKFRLAKIEMFLNK